MRRTGLAVAAAVLALAGASAAGATTGPDPYTIVSVTLKDGQLVLSKHLVSHVTYVDFIVSNRGKQTHNFRIGSQSTRTLKPGEKVHLLVAFPVYGSYPFRVTVHGTRVMRGRLQVESPQVPG
jgi:uncharacterized cupredoxin-like copper-binding protein